MRKTWVLAGAAVLIAVTVTATVVVSRAQQATPAAPELPLNTVKVERGKLAAAIFQYGTLTYLAHPDGSPYSVIKQARGTYTKLPEGGDKVTCGDVFYRVDDKGVLLLCGTIPAYRDLRTSSATTRRLVSISLPTTTPSPRRRSALSVRSSRAKA